MAQQQKRYFVIEMWENQEVPSFSMKEGTDEVFTTDYINKAKEVALEHQEGYILDFEEMKIIKP